MTGTFPNYPRCLFRQRRGKDTVLAYWRPGQFWQSPRCPPCPDAHILRRTPPTPTGNSTSAATRAFDTQDMKATHPDRTAHERLPIDQTTVMGFAAKIRSRDRFALISGGNSITRSPSGDGPVETPTLTRPGQNEPSRTLVP